MNDMSQNSDLVDQLKSLSIDRADPAATPMSIPRAWYGHRAPVKTLLLLGALAAGGVGVWYSEIPAKDLFEHAKETALAALPEAHPQGNPSAASVPSQTETAAVQSTPVPAPVALPVAPPAVVGSGYVVADRELALTPDIGGRIARLEIDTGDRFGAGDVIAVLNSDNAQANARIAQASLAKAEAELARSQTSLEEARAYLDRQEKLAARGSVPRTAVELARFAVMRQESMLRVNTQQIEIARQEVAKQEEILARHTITAPFSGVVVKRHLNVGDIAPSALDAGPRQGIATLIDPNALSIEVDVSETNLARLTPGQTANVRLDAYPDRDFPAELRTIAPKVSIQKGTVQVRLSFLNLPPGVFANMAAKVTFHAPEQTTSLLSKGH